MFNLKLYLFLKRSFTSFSWHVQKSSFICWIYFLIEISHHFSKELSTINIWRRYSGSTDIPAFLLSDTANLSMFFIINLHFSPLVTHHSQISILSLHSTRLNTHSLPILTFTTHKSPLFTYSLTQHSLTPNSKLSIHHSQSPLSIFLSSLTIHHSRTHHSPLTAHLTFNTQHSPLITHH